MKLRGYNHVSDFCKAYDPVNPECARAKVTSIRKKGNPTLDTIQNFAKFLGVDISYLMGETVEPSQKEKAAMEYTGLSSKSIQYLRNLQNPIHSPNSVFDLFDTDHVYQGEMADILEDLLCDESRFTELLNDIIECYENHQTYSHCFDHESKQYVSRYKASESLTRILDKLYPTSSNLPHVSDKLNSPLRDRIK